MKLIQTEAAIRTGPLDLSIPWPGRTLDPEMRFRPFPHPWGHVVGGRLYGAFGAFPPLLASIPYRLLGPSGLILLSWAGALLASAAVWKTARLAGGGAEASAPLAAALSALGTPLFFYALTLYDHTPAVAAAAWGVFFLLRRVLHRTPGDLLRGALLCALAAWLREEMYVLVLLLPLAAAAGGERRAAEAAAFAGVWVAAMLPLWLFHALLFGNPLGAHLATYAAEGPASGAGWLAGRLTVLRFTMANFHADALPSWSLGGLYLLLLALRPRLRREDAGRTLSLLAALAAAVGLWVLLGFLRAASPMRWLIQANGLFAAAPVLLLGLVRLPRGGDGSDEDAERIDRFLWTLSGGYVVVGLLGLAGEYPTGFHWGGRFFLLLYPLLCVPAARAAAAGWTAAPRLAPRAALAAAFAFSALLQAYSGRLLAERIRFTAALDRAVARRPERAVVTPDWFLPQDLAMLFYEREFYLVRGPSEAAEAFSMLRAAGRTSALWAAEVAPGFRMDSPAVVIDDGPLRLFSIEVRPIDLSTGAETLPPGGV